MAEIFSTSGITSSTCLADGRPSRSQPVESVVFIEHDCKLFSLDEPDIRQGPLKKGLGESSAEGHKRDEETRRNVPHHL